MVYVQDINGKALMPTTRNNKVAALLRSGKAFVVRRRPFTIRLLYETTHFVQEVTLGVDAGSSHIGLSATTESRELISAEVDLREDIVKQISQRRESRRTRRNHKTRYRKARFDNRRRPKGWIAPSVEQKIKSHINVIGKVHEILPISTIVVEVAQFDTQLLKNPEIQGEQYQQGEQMGFWNTREYVLYRDNHECQCCHGKSKDPVLNVHHIESRQTGGDSPSNLVTLCETCHKAYHKGELELNLKKNTQSLRDAAVMGIMRWELFRRVRDKYGNVGLTYGYKTKYTRIESGLAKSHRVDARCISGHPHAEPCAEWFKARQVPRHTRSLHVFTMSEGGIRRSSVAPHWIGKSRLQRFDTVQWKGITAFIAGSTNGRPVLRDIDWKRMTNVPSVNIKTVKFLSRKHGSFIVQTI